MPGPDHPLWRAAYRPLFLAAATCALLTPLVWLWPGDLPADPRLWHLHEFVFGMCGAAVGGYLLTALPAWTSAAKAQPTAKPTAKPTDRVTRGPLFALTLLWLTARLALPLSEALPFWLLLALALGYFTLLTALLARPLIAARLWGRTWAVVAVAAMALGEALFLAEMRRLVSIDALPLAMVLFFAALIGWIGGRALPAFTRSWLRRGPPGPEPQDTSAIAIAALAATVLGAGFALGDQTGPAGICMILAGMLQTLRMVGWRGWRAWRYPALTMLHLGWLWLPFGLVLTGTALLRPDLMAQSAALHALTMGAMGSMILAISARAAMARHDGMLRAGPGLCLAFALVWLSPWPRVLSGLSPLTWPDPLKLSALIWMLGWAIFLCAFRRALSGPVPAPVLSAPQPRPAP